MKRLLQSFLLTVCLWGTVHLGPQTPPAVPHQPANTPISERANFSLNSREAPRPYP